MTDTMSKVYHGLPASLRSVAASLWGVYLSYWRYGSETERLVEEAFGRESWSRKQWRDWQEERLAYVLHRAATQVPYYREQWAARRRRGERASWEYLENWPILEKEPVRQNPLAFVADDRKPWRMSRVHTSGTSGKPLALWRSLETSRRWYALFEARCRRWNGVSRHNRWAMFGGQLVTPVSQVKPPFWVWNKGLNQLYMSSYHLAPQFIESYLKAISHYRVTYLLGYTSSLYALAQAVLESGRENQSMTVAITNAEPVDDYQRSTIMKAFQCPVRETYGMAEMVVISNECVVGRQHLCPEAGWLEVIEDDKSLAEGAVGDLVCTGLLNIDMPLIRYRTGDRGALADEPRLCECGRSLPTLATIEGRADEVLFTMDGRRIGRLDPAFKADLPVREAQVIQEALDRVRVRYVPTPGFRPNHKSAIVQRIKARMGAVEIIMEPIKEIPRGPNGKFKAVICNLSKEEKEISERH